ncbi:Delta(7)-sterol 5(6)-desaturase [Alteripontixanthobacter maritimus]|uniref:Delta(7)-sterol 5(6)-desaturase n=2 Tax=Alteripontixanthobacter maritimus TaxID=2161824 RepID=A0A369Q7X8_9SPHN|nr:Delta(7)-sterol 5(6)-desaturase [Alteripontixanthobacter maritimus]
MIFAVCAAAFVGAIAVLERRRPLREQEHDEKRRTVRNLALGAGCAAVVAMAEVPLANRVAAGNLVNRRGFAQWFPRSLRLLAGAAAMDYGFYLWHVATHRVPFLYRFHRVHHIDPDMDASTAVRFHPADMLVSLPWRLVQVRLSGASPKTLRYWRNFFNASILFHHSNLRLPQEWDRRLSLVLTTPRMHGIHHSKVAEEQNANFTSGLSFWDRLHGTFRTKSDPRVIDIGVEDEDALEDLALATSLTAPFLPQPEGVKPYSS